MKTLVFFFLEILGLVINYRGCTIMGDWEDYGVQSSIIGPRTNWVGESGWKVPVQPSYSTSKWADSYSVTPGTGVGVVGHSDDEPSCRQTEVTSEWIHTHVVSLATTMRVLHKTPTGRRTTEVLGVYYPSTTFLGVWTGHSRRQRSSRTYVGRQRWDSRISHSDSSCRKPQNQKKT